MIINSRDKQLSDYEKIIARKRELIDKDINGTITDEEKVELKDLAKKMIRSNHYIRKSDVKLNKKKSI